MTSGRASGSAAVSDRHEPDPTRIVADSDVLVADLLVGGPSRDVMDVLRSHSWLEPIATEPLLAAAEAVIASLADATLAGEWRATAEDLLSVVEQPAGDRPALAAAYRGNASQIVTLDDRLRSASTGANLRGLFEVSVRSPEAFLSVVDPEPLYELAFDASYPGPDRPRRRRDGGDRR